MAANTASPALAEQFATTEQQRESAFLGMWTFLATEIMLFRGLFFGIVVYRVLYPDAARQASQHLYKSIGAINTAVLLTSSLAVALAALAARDGRLRAVVVDLLISAALGLVFLGIKALEYYLDYSEGLMPGRGSKPFPITAPGAELFINAYWFATGIHALHVLIGVGILAVIAQRVGGAGLPLPQRDIVVEVAGLYWHYVDIVWIFLFPVLYLVGG
jgi:cytochrome c oxidase subunit III